MALFEKFLGRTPHHTARHLVESQPSRGHLHHSIRSHVRRLRRAHQALSKKKKSKTKTNRLVESVKKTVRKRMSKKKGKKR